MHVLLQARKQESLWEERHACRLATHVACSCRFGIGGGCDRGERPLGRPWARTTSSISSSRAARCSIPSQNLRAKRDIGIRFGVIEALEADIPRRTRRSGCWTAAGKLVTPGLIDLHAHVFPYGSAIGIPADELVPFQATTTLVSAGDAGANNIAAFRRAIVAAARARGSTPSCISPTSGSPASRCPSSTTSTTHRPRPRPRRWQRMPTS